MTTERDIWYCFALNTVPLCIPQPLTYFAFMLYIAEIVCSSPTAPANGKARVYDHHTGRHITLHPGTNISAGEWITFACNRGFRRQGSYSSKCSTSGQWESSPPTCQGKDMKIFVFYIINNMHSSGGSKPGHKRHPKMLSLYFCLFIFFYFDYIPYCTRMLQNKDEIACMRTSNILQLNPAVRDFAFVMCAAPPPPWKLLLLLLFLSKWL